MTIKKYLGKTKEEAMDRARQELGPNMVVMNVKEIRGSGPLAVFQAKTYEVTAAVEDDSPAPSYMEVVESARNTQAEGMRRFEAVADQKLNLEQLSGENKPVTTGVQMAQSSSPRSMPQPIQQPAGNNEAVVSPKDEENLREAFREIGQMVKAADADGGFNRAAASTYDRNATIIKYNDPASDEYTREGRRVRHVNRYEPAEVREPERRQPPVTAKLREELSDINTGTSSNAIIKAIYNMLLDHEVDERYINQVMADLDVDAMGDNIETALNLVYQKLVLKFGPINPVTIREKKPKVVFFVGPTGVGKTTTIAKIASEFKLNQKRRVALFTADTYRIAAQQQLSVYGELMQIDVVVIYEQDDINEKISEKYSRYDLILVDTTGFSHRDEEQRASIAALLSSLSDKYDKQVYLLLSATTKYRDLKEIVDTYKEFTDFDLIFTKLDETNVHGNVLNIRLYADKLLSYVTTGQSVPSDIEIIDTQKMVRNLLGGA